MSNQTAKIVKEACQASGHDRTRLMDIVRHIHEQLGHVNDEATDAIAHELGCFRAEIESLVSFYSFFSQKVKGKVIIRLCDDVIDKMKGVHKIAQALEKEFGVRMGETTPDGKVTLEYTPCIGMCDQAPAALINNVVAPNLTVDKISHIASDLKKHADEKNLSLGSGDGYNADPLVQSAVVNNILKKGDVIFSDNQPGSGLQKAVALEPEQVINMIKVAKLRGRGGAGFPTGLKWQFTRAAKGDEKYIICNADEGEPGTFKDRVLLTEKFDLLFEGMTIAGYAIAAQQGILYLRGEYAYLKKFLEVKLKERKNAGLLGQSICGKKGFTFDIRLQMGAGSYICGEESALISSCEGLRGDPKTRPPFPAQKGYLAKPTTVNNVETFCCVTRILEKGADWFLSIGSTNSSGTKLLSISGSCEKPGVYEYPFGISITDILKDVGAQDAQSVLVGGPSGQFIGPKEYSRIICYNDLGTGGSMVIFGPECNLLQAVLDYMKFFVHESCGYCTPCRVGNVLMTDRLEQILQGRGEPEDLSFLDEIGIMVKRSSRCGLGQTSPNPILTTLKNFRPLYEKLVKTHKDRFQPSFDIRSALKDAQEITGRKSVIYID